MAMASRFRQYIAIQPVPSACSMWPPVGRGSAAVEDADVVQAQKSALENVAAFAVLAVDPPGEVEHQLVEDPLKKCAITHAAALLFDLVNAQRRPGMHRRIDIAERPLVRGKL